MKDLLIPHIAITPTPFPRTRQYVRKAEQEYHRIFHKINDLDIQFGNDLFNTEREYADIYTEYLNRFNANIDWIENVLKPKCWKIDRDYFSRTYKK